MLLHWLVIKVLLGWTGRDVHAEKQHFEPEASALQGQRSIAQLY